MSGVTPFARAAGGRIDDLEIETDEDSLVISGTVRIERDAKGLETARRLAALMAAAVSELESGELPERIAPAKPGRTVPNPF